MNVAWNRFARARFAARIPGDAASILILFYGAAVVALLSAGRLYLSQAVLLLGVPAVAVLGILRPEWMILGLVALPPVVDLPPLQMIVFTLPPLFGFILHGAPRLGWATGIYPLVGIVALGMLHHADLSGDAASDAEGTLKTFIYYALLVLLAFHAVVVRNMRVDTFVTVFVTGVVIAIALEPFLGDATGFESVTRHPFMGRFSYLVVMGFGLVYARFALNRALDRRRSMYDASLVFILLTITALSFTRVVWVAALLTFAIVAIWTRRKSFWVVVALLVAMALNLPAVTDQFFPGGSTNIADRDTLAQVTTGRSELWLLLWQRGVDALPLGNGWGYITSLDSVELFGFEGNFQGGASSFVYPHNDFLYLFVDLGIVGVGLIVLLWVSLVGKVVAIARHGRPAAIYDVRVLVPVLLVMFVLQLVANGTSIRFVGTRFFIVAGLVFGLAYRERVIGRSTPSGGDVRERGRMPVDGDAIVGNMSPRFFELPGSTRT
jgi:O-antigen ligase